MYGYLFSVVVLLMRWTVRGVASSAENIDIVIKTGRCRVECLKKYLPNHDNIDDGACRSVADCRMCWELCHSLFHEYYMWAPVCHKPELCTSGCNTACDFRNDPPETGKHLDVQWRFPSLVKVTVDSLFTHIMWPEPTPDTPVNGPPRFVYTILTRNRLEKDDLSWENLGQYASPFITLSTDELPYTPEMRLIGINDEGAVAESTFTPESLFFHPVVTIPTENGELRGSDVLVYIESGPMNISVDVSVVKGTIDATISWKHPNRTDLECKISDTNYCIYQVHWFFENCEYYGDNPPCPLTGDHFAQTRSFKYSEQPMAKLPELKFNTEYVVVVEVSAGSGETVQEDTFLITPHCQEPDEYFIYCHDPVKEQFQGKSSGENQTNMANNTNTLSIENPIVVKVLPLYFNLETGQVEANITWELVAAINQSTLEFYTVRYETLYNQLGDGLLKNVGEEKTSLNYFVLKMEMNCIYKIVVEAHFLNGSLEPKEIEVNTSEWNISSVNGMVAQPITQNKKHDLKTLNGVIIGITVITSCVILGIIVLFIYKKRKSFRDIIITKTTVAKSNSYKSNVGAGKANYSNQLLIISDEWELDPKQLKFSTPLGQGAFGKVVTGYYSDKKVAIKLVKEGAPVSYKEDLVAEINLMKRIGSHSNIVSMIGACTLCEPIALIMEFVPYGNLQYFLKKCRLEGDLRKGTNGTSEITYSMLFDSGGIENGVIIPADMLSFARQVAMAMEYLAEKKYVHRDLAARNILLDCNKVVKVCDFGLSRDIYNENQYKKLTNGKLPLKWMAIESLRDRIFTMHTDVWSFGILLWEIVTMGASPYPNIALADLYYVLVNGYRMDKPSNCSDELYRVMQQCWEECSQDRPTFTQLRLMLEDLLTQDQDYLVLENIDVPLNTSENSSTPVSDASSNPASGTSAMLMSQTGRDALTVNVCIHEKSTDRLLFRRDESDSSP